MSVNLQEIGITSRVPPNDRRRNHEQETDRCGLSDQHRLCRIDLSTSHNGDSQQQSAHWVPQTWERNEDESRQYHEAR